ncbi:hypothetical protein GCM10027443_14030 [Pontibacter brevis]
MVPAKVKHGSILLGGTLSASAYKTTNQFNLPLGAEEGTNILVNLRAKNGYFIDHDIAVGLGVTLEHDNFRSVTEEEERKFRRTRLMFGPFARYYLDNGIFGELSAEVGLLNFSTGQKSNLLEGGIGIGYAHFINQRIALEPLLTFRYFREFKDGLANVTFGPMLGFGVQAYIWRKRAHVIKEAL